MRRRGVPVIAVLLAVGVLSPASAALARPRAASAAGSAYGAGVAAQRAETVGGQLRELRRAERRATVRLACAKALTPAAATPWRRALRAAAASLTAALVAAATATAAWRGWIP